MTNKYDALEELESKATAGRWEYHEEDNLLDSPGVASRLIDIVPRSIDIGHDERKVNGHFIAAARNAVPTLIADVKALAEALQAQIEMQVCHLKLMNCDDEFIERQVASARAALSRIQEPK